MGLQEIIELVIKADDQATKSVEKVDQEIKKVDNSKVSGNQFNKLNQATQKTREELNRTKTSIGAVGEKFKATASSVRGKLKSMASSTKVLLGGAVTMVGGQLQSLSQECLQMAKDANKGWRSYQNAFDTANQGSKVSLDKMKKSIKSLAQTTGRSVGETRDSMRNLMLAGNTYAQSVKATYISSGLVAAGFAKDEVAASKMVVGALAGRAGVLKKLGLQMEDYKDKKKKIFKSDDLLADMEKKVTEAQEKYAKSNEANLQKIDNSVAALKTNIGQFLVEALLPMTPIIQKITELLSKMPADVQTLIGMIMLLTIGFTTLSPAIYAVTTLATALGGLSIAENAAAAATWLLNAAMTANPITLIVVAIAGLIAILAVLYNQCPAVKAAIDGFGGKLLEIGKWIGSSVVPALLHFVSTLANATGAAGRAGKQIFDAIIHFIVQIPGRIGTEFAKIPGRIMGGVNSAVNAAKTFGKHILDGAMNVLGIHSPGFIQNNIANEFESINSRIHDALPSTLKETENFSKKMMDSSKDFEISSSVSVSPTDNKENSNVFNLPELQENLNTAKTRVTTGMHDVNSNINKTLLSIRGDVSTSFKGNKNIIGAQMTNIVSSLKGSTKNIVTSFNTMKTGVVASAKTMKTGTASWISQLKANISSFYTSIRHPGGAGPVGGAGPAPSRSSGSRVFRSPILRYVGGAGPETNLNLNTLFNNDKSYFQGFDKQKLLNTPLKLLINGGKGAGLFSQMTNKTKKTVRSARTGNAQISRYHTSHLSFPVSAFEGSTPKINFEQFRALAEDVFSQTQYDFYFDSAKYGSWQRAFRAGHMNCSDGSDAIIALARACGLPASKVHGHWGNVGHYWANVAGHKMDTTGWQLRRTWTPSASHAGPAPKNPMNSTTPTKDVDKIDLTGNVTITHDLKNVPQGLDEKKVVKLLNDKTLNNGEWIRSLVNNYIFQSNDQRVKGKLESRARRSAGI